MDARSAAEVKYPTQQEFVWTKVTREMQRKGSHPHVSLADKVFVEAIGGDIDLVGHDWGAGHVYGVLSEKPGIVRSWAADCAGLLHADYQWHDMAQGWQAPELCTGDRHLRLPPGTARPAHPASALIPCVKHLSPSTPSAIFPTHERNPQRPRRRR